MVVAGGIPRHEPEQSKGSNRIQQGWAMPRVTVPWLSRKRLNNNKKTNNNNSRSESGAIFIGIDVPR